MEPQTASSYGQSAHYVGQEGARYFAWQRTNGSVGGSINARNFQNWIKSTDHILDFGCGGGFLAASIACQHRSGIEPNPAAREAARRNGIQCYAELSELPSGSIDVAISNHALEHVPYPIQALSELRRVMKPRGTLVLKLPIDDWRTQRKVDPDDINHHLYTWTPQLLFNCLTEAGFPRDAITISVYVHAWFPGAMGAFKVLPETLVDFGCRLFATLKKRRQLIAIVKNA